MVALRDTHEASFDFDSWAEKLNLPAEQKDKLQQCHAYVLQCMQKKMRISSRRISRPRGLSPRQG